MPKPPLLIVGIDVAAKTLQVAHQDERQLRQQTVPNDETGHRALLRDFTKRAQRVRWILEPTGVYHLSLALTLQRHPRCEVMVVNPRAIHNFAKAVMTRGKSDPRDAAVLRLYGERMPFVPWTPPSEPCLQLRTLTRRIHALTRQQTQEKNRLHAAEAAGETRSVILESLHQTIAFLRQQIASLHQRGLAWITEHPELQRRFEQLVSVKGIAEKSALALLGELCVLDESMDARQFTAHAGLDPIPRSSGQHRPGEHISKRGNRYLRAALFYPAQSAIRHQPEVNAFYNRLIARKKTGLVAVVAVMRKLLHAIVGMFKTNTLFQAELCFPTASEQVSQST